MEMHALKAHIENGRVVLDEPVNLPDGTELEVVPIDASTAMDADERAAFLRELDAACDEADAGQLVDATDVLAKLRARA